MTDEHDPLRPWLWPSEVAQLCHVSRTTVYRWIKRGEIPVLLQRKPFRIPRSALRKILSPVSLA